MLVFCFNEAASARSRKYANDSYISRPGWASMRPRALARGNLLLADWDQHRSHRFNEAASARSRK